MVVWVGLLVVSVVCLGQVFVSPNGSGSTCSQGLPCSLQQGVASTSATGGTIELSSETFVIGTTLVLGSRTTSLRGQSGTIIQCSGSSGAFVVPSLATAVFSNIRFLFCPESIAVADGSSTTIQDSVFSRGAGSALILTSSVNLTSMAILRSLFFDNSIIAQQVGLYNGGAALQVRTTGGAGVSLLISGCEFRNNSVVSLNGDNAQGGAVSFFASNAQTANLTILDSLFVSNSNSNTCTSGCNAARGGAMLFEAEPGGVLKVSRSKFVENIGYDDGGAIALNGVAELDTVLFEANRVAYRGSLGGTGGALFAKGSVSTSLTMSSVTFRNNSATHGGAISVVRVGTLSLVCNDW